MCGVPAAVRTLVVGLGNPGARYSATRHNVGTMLVGRLAERWRIALGSTSDVANYGSGRLGDTPIVIAASRTLMNSSGDAVAALCVAHAIERVVVAYDDLDLPLGRVRIRGEGGSGGHRGVSSVISAIGEDFVRVRIGIGRPPAEVDPVAFVLQDFCPDEHVPLERAFARAAEGIEILLREGVERAMDATNGRAE
jgi:peptidyl-tRNA hydrolase, PTH1 family